MKIQLYRGDCLVLMQRIPDTSVDMILCDLPYGTTQNKWDSIIPFELLWEQYLRVAKEKAAIVLTASQPFTSALISSNYANYSHIWYWQKGKPTGHLNAKKQPMREIEEILVFAKSVPNYYPQGLIPVERKVKRTNRGNYGECGKETTQTQTGYPTNLLSIAGRDGNTFHPTQKPVALMEYLICTYSKEGDVVMDNCMGSGTTGVACVNTNRSFIGIEKDENYFAIAKGRIADAGL